MVGFKKPDMIEAPSAASIISAILSALGLGVFIHLLFALTVYAFPFFVAATVSSFVYDTDTGTIAAFLFAFFAGTITIIAGKIGFATICSVSVRFAMSALYPALAGIGGYHAIKGLPKFDGAGETWTLIFAWIGPITVGATTWGRIVSLVGPDEYADATRNAFSGGHAANGP